MQLKKKEEKLEKAKASASSISSGSIAALSRQQSTSTSTSSVAPSQSITAHGKVCFITNTGWVIFIEMLNNLKGLCKREDHRLLIRS